MSVFLIVIAFNILWLAMARWSIGDLLYLYSFRLEGVMPNWVSIIFYLYLIWGIVNLILWL